jgi:2-polyprenyl-6-methoxyphenol hydroxylase-like FAD-dependent oxidoreductase
MVANLCQDEYDVIILEQDNTRYAGKYDGGLSLGHWAQKIFEVHIPDPNLLASAVRTEQLSTIFLDDAEGGTPRVCREPVIEDHRVAMTTWAAGYKTLLRGIDVESEIDLKTASKVRPRLRTGAKVEDAKYGDGTWTITYRSTVTNCVETETADILVAADGAFSTIREVTASGVTPKYTGVVAWRGRVPNGVVLEVDNEIRKDTLVWYVMRGSQYIILWVFLSQRSQWLCSDFY